MARLTKDVRQKLLESNEGFSTRSYYEGRNSREERIAALIGYSDHSNFYKAFKDFYGMTPRDYLAEYAESRK